MIPTHALGVDIGGTKTLVTLVDDSGTPGRVFAAPTPALNGPEAILDNAIGLARRVLSESSHPPLAMRDIGIGSAGVVDAKTGIVRFATTSLPGWAGTDIRGAFLRAFPAAVVTVVNDVQAFTLAETVHGSAAGRELVLGVMAGTGIGGGIVNGSIVQGAHFAAGHIGHVDVPSAAGMPCPCGRSGHLESVASGTAMTAAYRRAGGDADDLQAVAAAANGGDVIAQGILDTGADALGLAIGSIANVLDPDQIVVGGGVASLGEWWLARVRKAAGKTTMPLIGEPRIALGTLGEAAVAIGAARVARPLPAVVTLPLQVGTR